MLKTRLVLYLQDKGYSVTSAAKAAGVSLATLYRAAHGTPMSFKSLKKLAKLLEIEVADVRTLIQRSKRKG